MAMVNEEPAEDEKNAYAGMHLLEEVLEELSDNGYRRQVVMPKDHRRGERADAGQGGESFRGGFFPGRRGISQAGHGDADWD